MMCRYCPLYPNTAPLVPLIVDTASNLAWVVLALLLAQFPHLLSRPGYVVCAGYPSQNTTTNKIAEYKALLFGLHAAQVDRL